jgi:hypothetical protein
MELFRRVNLEWLPTLVAAGRSRNGEERTAGKILSLIDQTASASKYHLQTGPAHHLSDAASPMGLDTLLRLECQQLVIVVRLFERMDSASGGSESSWEKHLQSKAVSALNSVLNGLHGVLIQFGHSNNMSALVAALSRSANSELQFQLSSSSATKENGPAQTVTKTRKNRVYHSIGAELYDWLEWIAETFSGRGPHTEAAAGRTNPSGISARQLLSDTAWDVDEDEGETERGSRQVEEGAALSATDSTSDPLRASVEDVVRLSSDCMHRIVHIYSEWLELPATDGIAQSDRTHHQEQAGVLFASFALSPLLPALCRTAPVAYWSSIAALTRHCGTQKASPSSVALGSAVDFNAKGLILRCVAANVIRLLPPPSRIPQLGPESVHPYLDSSECQTELIRFGHLLRELSQSVEALRNTQGRGKDSNLTPTSRVRSTPAASLDLLIFLKDTVADATAAMWVLQQTLIRSTGCGEFLHLKGLEQAALRNLVSKEGAEKPLPTALGGPTSSGSAPVALKEFFMVLVSSLVDLGIAADRILYRKTTDDEQNSPKLKKFKDAAPSVPRADQRRWIAVAVNALGEIVKTMKSSDPIFDSAHEEGRYHEERSEALVHFGKTLGCGLLRFIAREVGDGALYGVDRRYDMLTLRPLPLSGTAQTLLGLAHPELPLAGGSGNSTSGKGNAIAIQLEGNFLVPYLVRLLAQLQLWMPQGTQLLFFDPYSRYLEEILGDGFVAQCATFSSIGLKIRCSTQYLYAVTTLLTTAQRRRAPVSSTPNIPSVHSQELSAKAAAVGVLKLACTLATRDYAPETTSLEAVKDLMWKIARQPREQRKPLCRALQILLASPSPSEAPLLRSLEPNFVKTAATLIVRCVSLIGPSVFCQEGTGAVDVPFLKELDLLCLEVERTIEDGGSTQLILSFVPLALAFLVELSIGQLSNREAAETVYRHLLPHRRRVFVREQMKKLFDGPAPDDHQVKSLIARIHRVCAPLEKVADRQEVTATTAPTAVELDQETPLWSEFLIRRGKLLTTQQHHNRGNSVHR